MEKGKTKFLVVVGILLLGLVITAIPAEAQGLVRFTVGGAVRNLRAEGLTEAVGNLSLTVDPVSAGTAQILPGSSIEIAYSGLITNAPTVLDVLCNVLATGVGALASANCTGPGLIVTVAGNRFTLSNPAAGAVIPLSGGAASPAAVIIITGVRIDASALGAGADATATVTLNSANPITDPMDVTGGQDTVKVGRTIASLTATVPATFVAAAGPIVTGLNPTLLTCVVSAAAPAIGVFAVPAALNIFAITVTENFSQALATVAQETLLTPNTPATVPTQIDFIISGIPTGYVLTPIGAVQTLPLAPTTPLTAVAIPAAVTGDGTDKTISYVTAATDNGAIEAAQFVFAVSNAATIGPGGLIGPITVRVRIGLVSGLAAAAAAPLYATLDFIDSTAGTGVVATIADCVTNLLFPNVANVAGFDTGIAIANTSADDASFGTGLGASAQSGSCVLTGWAASDGSVVTFTTPSVAAGTTFLTVLSSAANPSFNGFQGYIIAVCNFTNAHAFAFVNNGFGSAAGPTLAQGYLALILAGGRPIIPLGETLGQ